MNISVNKKSKLTYIKFKKAIGKHFLKYPEKDREELIKAKYKELFPNAKIEEDEPKAKSAKPKKDKRREDSSEERKED